MTYEKSCGGIVYRKFHGNTEILLIKHIKSGYWSFPKGHVEKGETDGVQYVKVTLDSGITFKTNEINLSTTAQKSLATFASQLDPQFDLAICGHTDNVGTLEVNKRISKQRAQSVANFLETKGVAASRLKSVEGYDYQYPVASNDTKEGQAQNRRVELYLIPSEAMIAEANSQAK